LVFTQKSFPEVLDRVVAVVNNQVITLTDLKIADAFGLYEDILEGEDENPLFLIMERMINQKIVIDATTRENISLSEEELETALEKTTERFGPGQFQKRLEEFGLSESDLKIYLKEKILYQKILSLRFGNEVSLNLEEIENYYKKTYLPSQEKKGFQPKPMIELLDEIEFAIKEKKIRKHIIDWINNLKRQAEIEIKFDNFKNIEEG